MLPGFDGVAGALGSTDGYDTLTLSNSAIFFCGHGVEDQHLGLKRFAAMQVDDTALQPNGPTIVPVHFDQRVADYVQITDDILGAPDGGADPNPDPSDTYWTSHNDCWSGSRRDSTLADDANGARRQKVCIDKFGAYGSDQNPQRDFPILEAFDDHLVLGRYLYPTRRVRRTAASSRRATRRRKSTSSSRSAASTTRRTSTCAPAPSGSRSAAVNGYLHHVVPDPTTKACVAVVRLAQPC